MGDWSVLEWIGVIGVIASVISIPVVGRLFVRQKREIRDLLYIEQERDNFRTRNAKQSVRLNAVDPERFIDHLNALRHEGSFNEAAKAALEFTIAQSEAFGLAAEVLTEQRILESGKHGEVAVKDAQRFAVIGLAANPDSVRLKELQKLAATRAEGLARDEPIETLDWGGMSDTDLNRLSHSLYNEGDYQLAEIAARRSIPLALIRTGEESVNYAGAISQHANCLGKLADFGGAEPLIRLALDINKKTVGMEHRNYATHLNNLAEILKIKGDFDGAEPLIQQALEIGKNTIGTEHPDYAKRLSNLAGLLGAKGDYIGAEPLFRQAVSVIEAAQGAEHPSSKDLRRNLEAFLRDKP